MSDTNDRTIDGYNKNIHQYIDATPQEPSQDVKAWIDFSLNGMLRSARILELGSGFGHDARYVESKGYAVQRTDGTPGFVHWLREHGHEAEVLNVVKDPIIGLYDLIFADAVLLHLSRHEMKLVLDKVYSALHEQGQLAFSLKIGDGEEWLSDKLDVPLFFCYWQPEAIKALLQDSGYKQVTIDQVSGGEGKPRRMHINAFKIEG